MIDLLIMIGSVWRVLSAYIRSADGTLLGRTGFSPFMLLVVF